MPTPQFVPPGAAPVNAGTVETRGAAEGELLGSFPHPIVQDAVRDGLIVQTRRARGTET